MSSTRDRIRLSDGDLADWKHLLTDLPDLRLEKVLAAREAIRRGHDLDDEMLASIVDAVADEVSRD